MSEWEKVEATPSWDFEKNKELIGVLVGKEENVGRNQSMLYHVERPNGDKVSVWGSTVLDSRLKFVDLGREVKIVFKGRKEGNAPQPYKDFDIFVKSSEDVSPEEVEV